jgi:3-phenylpropionate/trans-cinnamate dioxygenase ferredoxin component
MTTRLMPIPAGLEVPGTRGRPYQPVCPLDQLGAGEIVRITLGDLDLLLANTERGVLAIDDRCPHMSAPLSIGELDGCIIACPLHSGRFDLASGQTVQFPTTGGLDADGGYHPPWTPADRPSRPEPTDLKAQARALTRIRRLRYYPLRIRNDAIEIALPA